MFFLHGLCSLLILEMMMKYSIFAVLVMLYKKLLIHYQLSFFFCIFIKDSKWKVLLHFMTLQHELLLSELNFRLKFYIIYKYTHAKGLSQWLRGKESTGS